MRSADERSPVEMLTLLGGALHLWTAHVDASPDPLWISDNEALLSSEERRRYNRYHRAEDRWMFMVAHVMVRQVLSKYADRHPSWWEFDTNRYGRPEISNVDAPETLRFNLSHTPGCIALLVHDRCDAGVDVERTDRVRNLRGMAKRVFAESELIELFALEEQPSKERFYQLWTLKEAFIKAKGMGLAIPLDSFWFESQTGGGFTLHCNDDVEEDPDAWSFTLRQPSPEHVLATACRSGVDARPAEVFNFS